MSSIVYNTEITRSWNQLWDAFKLEGMDCYIEDHETNEFIYWRENGEKWTLKRSDSGKKSEKITWFLEQEIETGDGEEGYYGGELYSHKYDWIGKRVDEVVEAQEQKRLRREREEQERIEREQQKREQERQQAASEVQSALSSAKKYIENDQFGSAKSALDQVNQQAIKCNMQSDVSAMRKDIDDQLKNWVKDILNDIVEMIGEKNWDRAKATLDSLSQIRLSSSGLEGEASQLRTQLNQEKVEWQKAEEERIRKEKEANEEKAREIARRYAEGWQPEPTICQIAKSVKGKSIFIDELLQSQDGEFLRSHSEWQKMMTTTVEELWGKPQESIVHTEIKNALRGFSRDNVLTDECLEIGFKEDDEWKTETMFQSIKLHNEELYVASMKHQNCIDHELLEIFSLRYKNAYKEYFEEMMRRRNNEAAMKIAGAWLSLPDPENILSEFDGKDLATMVSESYRGDVEVQFKTPASERVLPKRIDNETAKEMILAGEEIIITIEECFNVQEQVEQGHLADDVDEPVHS